MKKNIVFFIFAIFLAACASGGVYHEVMPGETLYRISRSYGLSPRQLARANRIKNPAKIKAGQKLWIPGSSRRLAIKKGPSRKGEAAASAKIKKGKKKKKIYPDVKVGFAWPLRGRVITAFGTVDGEIHDGIDIAAKAGDPVKAAADGKVIYSGGEIKSYGNMVILKHAGAYSTIYAQNKSNAVKKGQAVKAGEIIAYVGSSGRSNSPLLHFEIRKGKDALDPLDYLDKKTEIKRR